MSALQDSLIGWVNAHAEERPEALLAALTTVLATLAQSTGTPRDLCVQTFAACWDEVERQIAAAPRTYRWRRRGGLSS